MRLDLDRVTRISREVATQVDERLSVAGVTLTEGGGNRVELLVTVEGCHREPSRHLLNVRRTGPAEFEHDVREKLVAALTRASRSLIALR